MERITYRSCIWSASVHTVSESASGRRYNTALARRRCASRWTDACSPRKPVTQVTGMGTSGWIVMAGRCSDELLWISLGMGLL
jgi:hypothetical protein